MWQWYCTTFCIFAIFAFDVTGLVLFKCVTVLLHTDWCIAITIYFFAFTFLLFYVFLLFYGLMPEIKMD